MADDTPPSIDLNRGIYFPQLTETFKISESELFDYYSTNSGMYPKNPGGGGGGGETSALVNRVATLEDEMEDVHVEQKAQNNAISNNSSAISAVQKNQDDLSAAAVSSISMLSDGYVLSDQIEEIEQIITNQNILRDSQENLYKAASSITL